MSSKPTVKPILEVKEAAAIIALHKGEATPDQQKLALDTIIQKVSETYGFHYYPDERDTAFALGRALVGQLIVGILREGTEPYRKIEQSRIPQQPKRGR